jgi:hypothetical protein
MFRGIVFTQTGDLVEVAHLHFTPGTDTPKTACSREIQQSILLRAARDCQNRIAELQRSTLAHLEAQLTHKQSHVQTQSANKIGPKGGAHFPTEDKRGFQSYNFADRLSQPCGLKLGASSQFGHSVLAKDELPSQCMRRCCQKVNILPGTLHLAWLCMHMIAVGIC